MYLLSAFQMAETIWFGFGDPNQIQNPEPLMQIQWCRGGLLMVSMPFMSTVEPRVQFDESDE